MQSSRPNLPDFNHPPVVEVALSVQFEELRSFKAVHLGAFWERIGRAQFPKTEQQPPVPKSIERFDQPVVDGPPRFEIINMPSLPRVLFLSPDETEIVQIQADRITFNWRKRRPTDIYPRFERLESQFSYVLDTFHDLITEQKFGVFKSEMAEVTYVNRMGGDEIPGRVEDALSVFSEGYTEKTPLKAEQVNLSLVFPMKQEGAAIGRLYIDGKIRTQRETRGMDLKLVARGKPAAPDIKAALKFCGQARTAIVEGFASITAKHMHTTWGRTDHASIDK